jgi:osmotically-inducible protein OsmY
MPLVRTHGAANNVDLKGIVDSPELVARAVKDARSVEGVRSVRNDLVVQ